MQYLRDQFRAPWDSDVRLDGKTVLITGANSGIGKETAANLATRGARVIMACRDMEKAQVALTEVRDRSLNDDVVCMKLDMADTKSIREFAQAINEGESKLNILINNAGVMCPYSKTADGFEMHIGVNHMGHFLLTYLLLDLLKRSSPARVVIVSSMAHAWTSIKFDDINSKHAYDKFKAYSQSKLANLLFSRSLAKRLEGTGVTTYAVHPGVVNTELWRHMNRPQRFVITMIRPFIKTPAQGARTIIYCAVEPTLDKDSGGFYMECAPADCSAEGRDEEVAEKMWELSCRMLNITWD
ncbi:retinol dehydrogenase 12, like isoform X1 [Syngnathus acus]|uniref:retinol dehydrogenase 12, like isoform X1 n=1 Tax=Syngnathus acus TaxID=161584 RepID=UPI001886465B|nr:retinol dehydrogenase 12, like isoform X1 [Syngnathus acus]